MGRKPILPPPDKCEERKTSAVIGPPFLWLLSFGGAKESSSPSGAKTRSEKSVAIATHYYLFLYRRKCLRNIS
jgi:hypothetical protein